MSMDKKFDKRMKKCYHSWRWRRQWGGLGGMTDWLCEPCRIKRANMLKEDKS